MSHKMDCSPGRRRVLKTLVGLILFPATCFSWLPGEGTDSRAPVQPLKKTVMHGTTILLQEDLQMLEQQ